MNQKKKIGLKTDIKKSIFENVKKGYFRKQENTNNNNIFFF